MKYLLIIGDGMGDMPQDELGGLTPLAAAATPNLDFLCKNGVTGLARTVPEGMPPGSDVAIMSLMGYYPKGILTGRGPLEAASQGIETSPDELVFRMNLINIDHQENRHIIHDHSAGNISSEEALELIKTLRDKLPLSARQKIFPGVSFRNIFTWPGMKPQDVPSLPPHDYLDKEVSAFLNDPKAKPIMDLVKASWEILENHPVNIARAEKGLSKANSIWLWGQGMRPSIKTYQQRFGINGATVSAVDLIKGLGIVSGLESIDVPGATGWIDTNYDGKVEATLKALESRDYVVLHIEAPDEASHHGDLKLKMQAIEDFDAKVIGPLLAALPKFGDFRLLIACDHFTPLKTKTHSSDPVPFIFYEAPEWNPKASGLSYNEANAKSTGILIDPASDLADLLFAPKNKCSCCSGKQSPSGDCK